MTKIRGKLLVHDYGMFTGVAERLSRDFEEVLYYCPWKADFPKSNDYFIGYGLPGITIVDDFFKTLRTLNKEEDTIMFTDIYDADLQDHLRRLGYYVWGTGKAEQLEIDRYNTRLKLKELGFPVPETHFVKGVDSLREFLKDKTDVYVKMSKFRGDGETFHHVDMDMTTYKLDKLAHNVGSNLIDFIVEEKIDAIEIGSDMYVIDGNFPSTGLWGIEIKDAGYAGRVDKVENMPWQLQECNKHIKPLLESSRGDFSNEVRVDIEGTPFLIDPTPRKPSPPSQCLQEIYENWGEIVFNGARGKLVEPKPVAKFAVEIMVYSMYAEASPVKITYPKRYKQWIKTRNNCIIDGVEWIIPRSVPMNIVCSIVGIGDSLKECFDHINKVAETIEVEDKNVQLSAMNKALDTVKRAEEYGIIFDVTGKDKKVSPETKKYKEEVKPDEPKTYKHGLYYTEDYTDKIMWGAMNSGNGDSVGLVDED